MPSWGSGCVRLVVNIVVSSTFRRCPASLCRHVQAFCLNLFCCNCASTTMLTHTLMSTPRCASLLGSRRQDALLCGHVDLSGPRQHSRPHGAWCSSHLRACRASPQLGAMYKLVTIDNPPPPTTTTTHHPSSCSQTNDPAFCFSLLRTSQN
jgi:hypothetical protein